jgi:hypothetical protein
MPPAPFIPTSDIVGTPIGRPAELSGGLPVVQKNSITVMFSGGVDSTALAITLAEQYDHIHLVTYKNGYGHFHHDRTVLRVQELNEKLGHKFSHAVISTKDYFDQVLVNTAFQDYRAFKSGFVWCMGCKMAMHMRSAIYCLENGVRFMTDGSNVDTEEMVEQMLISLTLIHHFYEDLTVEFGTPVYNQRRAASKERIKSLGLNMGVELLDRHMGIQPTCLAGELYYLPYLLFNKRVRHDEAAVADFIATKSVLCRTIIEAYFREKHGVALDDLLADRRRQLGALGPRSAPATPPTETGG